MYLILHRNGVDGYNACTCLENYEEAEAFFKKLCKEVVEDSCLDEERRKRALTDALECKRLLVESWAGSEEVILVGAINGETYYI